MQVSFFAPSLAPSAPAPSPAADQPAAAGGGNADVFASMLDSQPRGGNSPKSCAPAGEPKTKAPGPTGNAIVRRGAAPVAPEQIDPEPAVNSGTEAPVCDPINDSVELGAGPPADVPAAVKEWVPVQPAPVPELLVPVLPAVAVVPTANSAFIPAPARTESTPATEAPAGQPADSAPTQAAVPIEARGSSAAVACATAPVAPNTPPIAPASPGAVTKVDRSPTAPVAPATPRPQSVVRGMPPAVPQPPTTNAVASPANGGGAPMVTADPLQPVIASTPVIPAPALGVTTIPIPQPAAVPAAPVPVSVTRSPAAPTAPARPRPQSVAPRAQSVVPQAAAANSPPLPADPASAAVVAAPDPFQPAAGPALVVSVPEPAVTTVSFPTLPAVPALVPMSRSPAVPAAPTAPRLPVVAPPASAVLPQQGIPTPAVTSAVVEEPTGKGSVATRVPAPIPVPVVPVGPALVSPVSGVAEVVPPIALGTAAPLAPATGESANPGTSPRPVVRNLVTSAVAEATAPAASAPADVRPALPKVPPLRSEGLVAAGVGEESEADTPPPVASEFRVRQPVSWRTLEQARATGAQIVPPHGITVRPPTAELPVPTATPGETISAGNPAPSPMLSSPTLAQVLVETGAVNPPRPAKSGPATAPANNPMPSIASPAPLAPPVAVATVPPSAPEIGAAAIEVPANLAEGLLVDEVSVDDAPRAETPVRGLREILAAGSARLGRPELPASKGATAQNFLNVEKQRVGGDEPEVGTRTANRAQPMSFHAPALSSADAALETFELPGAAASIANQPTGTQVKQPAEIAGPRSFAAAAVREVMNVVEKAQETGRTHLELKLPTQDSEGLRVHLDWRDGVVHARFVAQTPELQRSLSREWEAVAPRFAEKGLKFSEPSFESNGQSSNSQSGQTAFGSDHQQHRARGHSAHGDDLPEFSLPSAAAKGATASGGRPTPRTPATTSPALADTRGLRVWA